MYKEESNGFGKYLAGYMAWQAITAIPGCFMIGKKIFDYYKERVSFSKKERYDLNKHARADEEKMNNLVKHPFPTPKYVYKAYE